MLNTEYYNLLSSVISYPNDNYRSDLDKLFTETNEKYPECNEFINLFKLNATLLTNFQLEEYYLQTFLLQPISSLDIGFVLFGNDSKRNEFLVNMQSEQLKTANACGIELADHLPNVITLIPKILDDDFRNEFVCSLLIPALSEISRKFNETDNFYRFIITLVEKVFLHDFGHLEYEQIEINKNIKF